MLSNCLLDTGRHGVLTTLLDLLKVLTTLLAKKCPLMLRLSTSPSLPLTPPGVTALNHSHTSWHWVLERGDHHLCLYFFSPELRLILNSVSGCFEDFCLVFSFCCLKIRLVFQLKKPPYLYLPFESSFL